MSENISFTRNVFVTDENIDDIMVTALEGGINYWCRSAVPKEGDYKGAEVASDVISRKGILILTDLEDETEQWELNQEKLLSGISQYLSIPSAHKIVDEDTNELDCSMIDAEIADLIIQLALFDKLVYG